MTISLYYSPEAPVPSPILLHPPSLLISDCPYFIIPKYIFTVQNNAPKVPDSLSYHHLCCNKKFLLLIIQIINGLYCSADNVRRSLPIVFSTYRCHSEGWPPLQKYFSISLWTTQQKYNHELKVQVMDYLIVSTSIRGNLPGPQETTFLGNSR